MSIKTIFKMPKPVGIKGRTSTITNSFVNGIIPVIEPTEKELEQSLKILKLNKDDLRCAYCGDKSSEWDHLRPIVVKMRPTGHFSHIHNLVPACGKCNQSKGGQYWKVWMKGNATLSPKTRAIPDLNKKVKCLEAYEKWGNIKPYEFEKLINPSLWKQHWRNLHDIHTRMKKADKLAVQVRDKIRIQIKKIEA